MSSAEGPCGETDRQTQDLTSCREVLDRHYTEIHRIKTSSMMRRGLGGSPSTAAGNCDWRTVSATEDTKRKSENWLCGCGCNQHCYG